LKTSQGAACYRIGRNSPISGAEIGGENFGAATGKDRAARARSRGGRAAASRMPPIRQPPIVGADLSNLKISPAVRTLSPPGKFRNIESGRDRSRMAETLRGWRLALEQKSDAA